MKDHGIDFKTKRNRKSKGKYKISIDIADLTQWDYDVIEEMYNRDRDDRKGGAKMSLTKEDKEWIKDTIVTVVTEAIKPVVKRLDVIETRLDNIENRLDNIVKKNGLIE